MRSVSIVSAGMTAFGSFPERNIRDLACEAGRSCLDGAGVSPSQVEALYVGNFAGPSFTGQNHIAPWIGAGLGLHNVPCTRFEAACASGGAALFHAWTAIAGGAYDMVLVLGVESMTSQSTAKTTEILASAGDIGAEAAVGATFPGLFGLITSRHMHEFGTTRQHLAAVAVKNHSNGLLNPRAHLRKAVTIDQVLASRPISEPLTLFDCSLISDGAAAVLLCASERAAEFDRPVRIRGVAQASDRLALHEKADITTFPAVLRAAEKAYAMAGVVPSDIDFAELHDCFTIAEIIALEDLGLFPRGQAGPAGLAGKTSRDGELPINTSGGLKSKGHPVGATGVAQVCEVFWQLRGEAGERQISDVSLGLTENLGGSGATAVVGIYSR
ncbi:MAG: thiolase domain-containing protein [Acidobacteria bacterium]|nr:thiolase domain-containing protein [Acidobacteriota bacterium]MDA1236875.1 thiolase domain-containing protein [Acidobacteriota bacterium]